MEPHVSRSDNGEIAVMDDCGDGKGWWACFKNGQWHDRMLFDHYKLADFTPVHDQGEVYRVYNEARAALGLPGEEPHSCEGGGKRNR
jgi:hypothetical protein